MVVIASREGQFANRIIHFANFFSFCKTHNIKLVHLHFQEYEPYFPNLADEKKVYCVGSGLFSKIALRFFGYLIKWLTKLHIKKFGMFELVLDHRSRPGENTISLNNAQTIKKCKRKIMIFSGWLFRDPQNFKLQEENIRKAFVFPELNIYNASDVIRELRGRYQYIVGVHIRRGDYKTFENGKWYYNDEVYFNKMQSLLNQFTNNKQSVAFLICSNENVNTASFSPLPVFFFNKDFVTDILMLSKSNYIIGPPSTFSAFASYWGKKPMFHIANMEDEICLDKFQIIDVL